MRLYADRPDRRARQVASDVGLLAWAVLWALVARAVHQAVLVLAEPGRSVEDLGRSIADSMGSAAGHRTPAGAGGAAGRDRGRLAGRGAGGGAGPGRAGAAPAGSAASAGDHRQLTAVVHPAAWTAAEQTSSSS
jgi:hypothetical protein